MNVLRSNSVFPSYSKIKQQMVDKRCQAYERVINRLEHRLDAMQRENDFAGDHERIKDCIITLSAQSTSEKPAIEKEPLVWAHQRHPSGPAGQESLNYYIEDDKEEENNYETFLKFKKRALERDLEEDRFDRLSGKERRKQQQEEEQLFKHLYADEQQDHPRLVHTQQLGRLQKKGRRQSRPFIPPRRLEEETHLADYRQKLLYEKNKKFLTENYMQILKKLDSTNMVKWRILDDGH